MATIIDNGRNNHVIGDHADSPNLKILFKGSDNTVVLGPDCRLSGEVQLFKDRGEIRFSGQNGSVAQIV